MIKHFQPTSPLGRTPTYVCRACKKTTRETGHDESSVKLCAFCFREAELENSLNDGHITQEQYADAFADLQREYKRGRFSNAAKRGSAELKQMAKATVARALEEIEAEENAKLRAERIERESKRTPVQKKADAGLPPIVAKKAKPMTDADEAADEAALPAANEAAAKAERRVRAKKNASQAPSAKNARRIIRNYLRIAMEVTMHEDERIPQNLGDALAAADAALATLPGYEAR